ncbi:sel1 repeat family protein [Massilia violaceinigra]|uniref:Sel1 repeat family protein n=1 Tax=Massilia violaceinigra TaxID=2045208 RepID=A0ABY4A7H2_9BURK|nr:sel1 repeat family protein [Massilia violaceinigra]UOD30597.1 sel1 repeat family protein [Massilia violaceinigra]
MKKTLFCLALMLGGVVHADELADANALFAKKSYPQALQLYTKLANGGNAEAQLHMGEMYFYGEAGTVDLAKAETWFKKSAAKGNKTAAASLEMMKKRDARRAELDYWIGKYDGAELSAGQFRCPAPRIPAMSKQNDEIESVSAKVAAWQDCYNGFVRNLNESSPLTKRIPKDIADLLTKDEAEQSRLHLEGVYAGIAENAKVSAKLVLADFGAWRSATDAYIKEHNRIVTDAAATAPRKGD